MSTPTILFFGSTSHPSLGPLYNHLKGRDRRRVVFLPLETFPSGLEFYLELGPGFEDGLFIIPEEQPVALDDLVSVCLDGYYIAPEQGETLSPEDREYLQVESWATLIALFHRLSRRCLVANHVLWREHLNSRLSVLAYFQARGLPVPRVLVTSQPEAAQVFFDEQAGQVIYRPVGGRQQPFRAMEAADLERLHELKGAPIHFEESPRGLPAVAVVVGSSAVVLPREAPVPVELVHRAMAACHELGLFLAEVVLREEERGWLVTDLRTFPGFDTLQDAQVAEAVSNFLEEGRPSPE
ncbi:MAG: hypothetical protein AMXMBFR33_67950 [Candidatus Xenobia bacterium]